MVTFSEGPKGRPQLLRARDDYPHVDMTCPPLLLEVEDVPRKRLVSAVPLDFQRNTALHAINMMRAEFYLDPPAPLFENVLEFQDENGPVPLGRVGSKVLVPE